MEYGPDNLRLEPMRHIDEAYVSFRDALVHADQADVRKPVHEVQR